MVMAYWLCCSNFHYRYQQIMFYLRLYPSMANNSSRDATSSAESSHEVRVVVLDVLGEDPPVVECQSLTQHLPQLHQLYSLGVVSTVNTGEVLRPAPEHHANGMSSLVSGRVGVHPELLQTIQLKTRLLPHLPYCCSLHGLSNVDESSWDGIEARGWVPSEDQDQVDLRIARSLHLNDGVDSQRGGAETVLVWSAVTGALVGVGGAVKHRRLLPGSAKEVDQGQRPEKSRETEKNGGIHPHRTMNMVES